MPRSETLFLWQKRCRLLEELVAVYREIEAWHSRGPAPEAGKGSASGSAPEAAVAADPEATDRATFHLEDLTARSGEIHGELQAVDAVLRRLPPDSRTDGATPEIALARRLQVEILRLNVALTRRLEEEQGRAARELDRSTSLRQTLEGMRPGGETPPYLVDVSA